MDANLLARARATAVLTESRLQLTIPSVLAPGERFDLRITFFGPDCLPSAGLTREIVFPPNDLVDGLPSSVRLDPSGDGMMTVGGLRARAPGVARIEASVEGLAEPAKVFSNPAWIEEDPAYRVFWGDLHVHTKISDCSKWACSDPAFCYEYARDASHLDFAAAADHLRGIAADESHWPKLVSLVSRYDEPGRFVPILGFESSHSKGFGGDNNAYFLEKDAPYFWVDREDMRGIAPKVRLEELWRWLDGTGKNYITIPHHTGRKQKNRTFEEAYHDPAREPLFEIYSGWGSSETRFSRFPMVNGNAEDAAYFVDAIRAGCRFGVIASSDDHATRPGGQSRHRGTPLGLKRLEGYHHQGVAAVRAGELTREALWRGLKSRATWGSTLTRDLIDVRLGTLETGTEAALDAKDSLRGRRSLTVRFTAHYPGPTSLTLVRNGEAIAQATVPAAGWNEVTTVELADEARFDEVAIRGSRFSPAPFVAYYVRAESQLGYTAWTSPIWLSEASG